MALQKCRVFLYEMQPVFMTGMFASLKAEPDIQVVGHCSDAHALPAMCGMAVPDVVIFGSTSFSNSPHELENVTPLKAPFWD